MDSLNFDYHSKTSTFKKFKHLLCKYYPTFSKICRSSEHLGQLLVLLYNCVPNLSQFFSIDKLLKNDNAIRNGKKSDCCFI